MKESSSPPVDINGKPFNRAGFVVVLLMGAFLTILNQTLLVTALPKIIEDLHVSAYDAQWLITSFMLINGILIPASAYLLHQIESRKLYLIAMGSFILGTIICALSTTFSHLLLGRIIQAIGSGVMIPLVQTLMFLVFPANRRGEAMGLVGIVIAFSPAIGPTLAGWIVDVYHWRYLFYFVFPLAVINLFLAFYLLKNVIPLTKPKLDILSFVLSCIGLGSLLYGISLAGDTGWSNSIVWITCVIGIVILLMFSLRQLRLKEPLLELRVFKSRTFAVTTVIVSIIFMTMIGSEILLPIFTQKILGYSALQSGLVLLPGAIVLGIISPISGKIFDKYGIRTLTIVGMTILLIGTFPFMFLTNETTIWWLIFFYMLRMVGMGLTMMPLATAGINALPQKLVSHGTAANNTVRQVFASLGAAIMVGVMTISVRNFSTSQHVLTEAGSYSKAMVIGINNGFMAAFVLVIFAFIICFLIKDNRKGR